MKNINVWLIVTYVIAFVLAYIVIEQIKKAKIKQSAKLQIGKVGAGETMTAGVGTGNGAEFNTSQQYNPNFNPKTHNWNQIVY